MIDAIRVQNYKALRDVSIALTPMHILIGPNDSGKTSILEAMTALCRSVDASLPNAFIGSWAGRDLVWHGSPQPQVTLWATGSAGEQHWVYELWCWFASGRQVAVDGESISIDGHDYPRLERGRPEVTTVYENVVRGRPVDLGWATAASLIYEQLSGIQYYRWNPRFLSLPVAPDSKRRFRMEPSGFGLALCLDDILGYDRDVFIQLERQFCALFPHIRSIKLISEPGFKTTTNDPELIPSFQRADGKGLHIQYVDGHIVPASQVSDGVLLILAYLAILYSPEPPRVLLVEEPENGIHPRRLRDVLTMLRELIQKQARTQVILTTHSPYVLDLFTPEEVTLTQMQSDGSVAVRRLSESRLVQDQSDIFTLGEIWTAEGDEALAEPAAAPAGSAE